MNCFSRKIVKHFTNKIDLRSFQKKVSQEELKKYLDPYGFLKEDECSFLINFRETILNRFC